MERGSAWLNGSGSTPVSVLVNTTSAVATLRTVTSTLVREQSTLYGFSWALFENRWHATYFGRPGECSSRTASKP